MSGNQETTICPVCGKTVDTFIFNDVWKACNNCLADIIADREAKFRAAVIATMNEEHIRPEESTHLETIRKRLEIPSDKARLIISKAAIAQTVAELEKNLTSNNNVNDEFDDEEWKPEVGDFIHGNESTYTLDTCDDPICTDGNSVYTLQYCDKDGQNGFILVFTIAPLNQLNQIRDINERIRQLAAPDTVICAKEILIDYIYREDGLHSKKKFLFFIYPDLHTDGKETQMESLGLFNISYAGWIARCEQKTSGIEMIAPSIYDELPEGLNQLVSPIYDKLPEGRNISPNHPLWWRAKLVESVLAYWDLLLSRGMEPKLSGLMISLNKIEIAANAEPRIRFYPNLTGLVMPDCDSCMTVLPEIHEECSNLPISKTGLPKLIRTILGDDYNNLSNAIATHTTQSEHDYCNASWIFFLYACYMGCHSENMTAAQLLDEIRTILPLLKDSAYEPGKAEYDRIKKATKPLSNMHDATSRCGGPNHKTNVCDRLPIIEDIATHNTNSSISNSEIFNQIDGLSSFNDELYEALI